jgi:mRNA interferase RelE/StbE
MLEIVWRKSAQKELSKLTKPLALKVVSAISELAENPFPQNSKKLTGTDSIYRIRIGDYRVVYNVEKEILTITIIRIRHRKEVYRGL